LAGTVLVACRIFRSLLDLQIEKKGTKSVNLSFKAVHGFLLLLLPDILREECTYILFHSIELDLECHSSGRCNMSVKHSNSLAKIDIAPVTSSGAATVEVTVSTNARACHATYSSAADVDFRDSRGEAGGGWLGDW
jgi:hypothetical protein